MFYDFTITIPKNTPETAPVEVEAKLNEGTIRYVEVAFPPGPAALAHLQIWDGLHQVWPTNPGGSFAWNDYTIKFDDEYVIQNPMNILTLVGWNEDDSFDHTITVRFKVEPAATTIGLERRAQFIRSVRG